MKATATTVFEFAQYSWDCWMGTVGSWGLQCDSDTGDGMVL